MKEKIIQIAEGLVGKYCKYGNQYLTIQSYKIDDDAERIYIYTSMRKIPYDRPLDAAIALMAEFQEVESEGDPIEAEEVPAAANYSHLVERTLTRVEDQTRGFVPAAYDPPPMKMLGSNNLASELKEIMMENIKKLKEDKEFLPQAEAINSNVNTIIDLAKTEIAYMMAVHKTGK